MTDLKNDLGAIRAGLACAPSSPTSTAALWALSRVVGALEKKLTPPIEATFETERQPGEDDPDEL